MTLISEETTQNMCPVCGKPYRKAASGSMTGWIFGQKTCLCNAGVLRSTAPPISFSGDDNAVSTFDFEPGTVLSDRYKVVRLIGRGGMGSVYLVNDLVENKQYALKTLNSGSLTDVVWARFLKEANVLSRLDHSCLLKVHDTGFIEGSQPFFVTDYVEGETLAQRLKSDGSMSLEATLPIVINVAFGLDCAHNAGVVHRDLKPSNIIISSSSDESQPEVKLIDFGIAKLASQEQELALTTTGEVFGTPYYMSPEQCVGAAIDHRSDLYSLGCVMYEMLTGVPPFMSSTAMSVLMQHQTQPPPSLKESSLGKSFPPALDQVIIRLLEKKPEDRYQSASDLVVDLTCIKSGKGLLLSSSRHAHSRKAGIKYGPLMRGAGLVALWIASVLAARFIVFPVQHEQPARTDSPQPKAPVSDLGDGSNKEHLDERLWEADTHETKFDVHGHEEFTDDDLDRVARMPNLVNVNLDGTSITDDGLRKLKTLTHLQDLSLAYTHITGEGLADLTAIPSLTKLSIHDCKQFENKNFKYVAAMNNLHELAANNSPITDQALEQIAKLPSLKWLNLAETNISDDGMQCLKQTPSLRNLDISHTRISGRGLQALVNLPGLVSLDMNNCLRVKPADFALIGQCKNLKVLFSFYMPVTDVGLSGIKNLRLVQLHISDSQVTDEGLRFLSDMPLTNLHAGHNHITDKGVKLLSHLPLQELWLYQTDITDKCVPSLLEMTGLKRLDIHAVHITNKAYAELSEHKKISFREGPQ